MLLITAGKKSRQYLRTMKAIIVAIILLFVPFTAGQYCRNTFIFKLESWQQARMKLPNSTQTEGKKLYNIGIFLWPCSIIVHKSPGQESTIWLFMRSIFSLMMHPICFHIEDTVHTKPRQWTTSGIKDRTDSPQLESNSWYVSIHSSSGIYLAKSSKYTNTKWQLQ